jgi:hypothetical protein
MRVPGNKLIATDSLSTLIAVMEKKRYKKPIKTNNKETARTRRRKNNATVGL